MTVTDNPAARRFEMPLEGGAVAFCDYVDQAGVLYLTHAEVPAQYEGKGYGGRLAKGTFDAIRASGRKAVPRCGFMVAYAKRHPEVADLIAG